MYEYILKQLTKEQLERYVDLAKKIGMNESVIDEGMRIINNLKGEQK